MLSSPPCSFARCDELAAALRGCRRRRRRCCWISSSVDHAGEAVGAEDVDVARLRLVVLQVDDDLILHAERARDDVLRQLAASARR